MHADAVVAVIGLGYVGLPRAAAFGKQGRTLGFDVSATKIAHDRSGVDPSREIAVADLAAAAQCEGTTDPACLDGAGVIIVAAPTMADGARQPDCTPLAGATTPIGRHTKPRATVVSASTAYPGATEETCIPILERASGMRRQRDFHVGLSPARFHPGDREHAPATASKVVSGDATRRSLDIALVNVPAIMVDKIGTATGGMLRAAGTAWHGMPTRRTSSTPRAPMVAVPSM